MRFDVYVKDSRTAYERETDAQVQAFLKYLYTGTSGDAHTARLAELVYEARQNPHWKREYMTLEMIKHEQQESGIAIGRKDGRSEGIKPGEQRRAEHTARCMLSEAFSAEQTARLTGLSPERVQELNSKFPVSAQLAGAFIQACAQHTARIGLIIHSGYLYASSCPSGILSRYTKGLMRTSSLFCFPISFKHFLML